ncbi:hypothetical protein HELRODRAFT_79655 [Helobdella robusta]|uniref:HAT C-terminal dimerisation domain-containing protein n=1 Tax=Helobdella robusta TaxID=6412 RepID=T1G3R8_HELRO|nr:hypothetical protein HELRODRAFT_79655 [Helobdella robusta]ESO04057.1 hypothetical protein HELRODRAFT_79655 [Helobdella robusta]
MEEIVQSSEANIQQQVAETIESEVDKYLLEPLLPRTENPLLWWKMNHKRFPSLAAVARVYLSAPPTSVPSERLFSVAGEVISDHRSSLLPENASKLIFFKYNKNLI